MAVILVTGTDSGVGKTELGRGLAATLRMAGRTVVAIKPVETGVGADRRQHEDGAQLAATTGQQAPLEALRRFAAPLDPALAADRESDGEPLDLDALLLQIEEYAATAEVTLLEGAGGLLAPLTWEWNIVDLARSLGASALVAAVDRRGAINQVLLALSALELAGIPVLGIVLTAPAEADESTGSNAGAIARLSGVNRVVALPRIDDPQAPSDELAQVAGWLDQPPPVPEP